MTQERPINFNCEGNRLDGIIHLPEQPAKQGLLIIVGGPQYRVGSHRQFLLLARNLAATGIAVMRFDYRGMGDSEGEMGIPEPCEHIDQDIRTAVDAFITQVPELEEVALWGLCDGASAALLYAHTDPRVTGVAVLNPWVSTAAGAAKAYLKHYYTKRLLSADFWRKILHFEFNFIASLKSFLSSIVAATSGTKKGQLEPRNPKEPNSTALASTVGERPVHERMADGLQAFTGRVLLIISGNDLIAAEFMNLASSNEKWRQQLLSPRITCHTFQEADHTFSCRAWRDQVAVWTRDWMQSSGSVKCEIS